MMKKQKEEIERCGSGSIRNRWFYESERDEESEIVLQWQAFFKEKGIT